MSMNYSISSIPASSLPLVDPVVRALAAAQPDDPVQNRIAAVFTKARADLGNAVASRCHGWQSQAPYEKLYPPLIRLSSYQEILFGRLDFVYQRTPPM